MKVVLTGASGLLGPAIVASLRADGHETVRLVRRETTAPDEARWDPSGGTVDPGALRGASAVIHLAGLGLGDRPWTPAHRRAVMDSRVQGTETIARAVAELDVPLLLSASGVGYYGNPGDRVLTEDDGPGSTYLAEICQAWEASTAAASDSGTRVALLRTAVVLSAQGGAYGKLLPLARLGLAGRIGSGQQWWSWISLDDYVRAVRHIIDHESVAGPVNLSAPEPLTNQAMTGAMGRVLHRPTVLAVPGWAIRIPLRDFAEDLLGGQRVVPARLLDDGFTFAHPTFEPALREVLAQGHPRSTS